MTRTPADVWDDAPCGLLTLRADSTIVAANTTFLGWVGRPSGDVVGVVRLPELLSVGGRIYWETHLSPMLHVDGRAEEVALELRAPDGRLPVLITAVVAGPDTVHVAISSARDRARYERELLEARRSAERSETQVRALQVATAALSRAIGVKSVADALLESAVGSLGAAAATLWLVDDAQRLVPHGALGERVAALSTVASRTAARGHGAAFVDGRAVMPLRGQTALHGIASLVARDDPGADPLDLEVLTAVGQQAGLALDRAVMYEQSASVARELQHSLLAVDPPDDPRFAVATTYRPGVEMLEVGGDWHDVFLAREGRLSVVVGDVVGRGLKAASAMGQLRSAVRAVAGEDSGPAQLLARLDRFVEQVEAASMATIAYAELDLATGLVDFACAGHLPPVLLPAGGEPRLLWGGRSTPLGAFGFGVGLDVVPRAEAQVQLAAGDQLLLYTDGLVERRDRALDDGLDRLVTAAAQLRGAPLDAAVRSLTASLLRDEETRDDVCVLLLSWPGTTP